AGARREVREVVFVGARRAGSDPYGELREGVLALLRRVGCPVTATRVWQGSDQPWVHPGCATALDRDGSPVGYVAHLHPGVARALELPATAAIACLDLRALLRAGRRTASFRALPGFPELPVDVALLVPAASKVADL